MTNIPPRRATQISDPDASLDNWMAWFCAPDGTVFPLEMGRIPDPIIVKGEVK